MQSKFYKTPFWCFQPNSKHFHLSLSLSLSTCRANSPPPPPPSSFHLATTWWDPHGGQSVRQTATTDLASKSRLWRPFSLAKPPDLSLPLWWVVCLIPASHDRQPKPKPHWFRWATTHWPNEKDFTFFFSWSGVVGLMMIGCGIVMKYVVVGLMLMMYVVVGLMLMMWVWCWWGLWKTLAKIFMNFLFFWFSKHKKTNENKFSKQ